MNPASIGLLRADSSDGVASSDDTHLATNEYNEDVVASSDADAKQDSHVQQVAWQSETDSPSSTTQNPPSHSPHPQPFSPTGEKGASLRNAGIPAEIADEPRDEARLGSENTETDSTTSDAPDNIDQPAFETDSDDPTAPPAPSTDESIRPIANPATGLQLADVLNSVVDCYPEIEVAIGEIEAARGKILASWGEFDSVFAAHSISQPLGFYQTYRNGAGVSRPLYGGGEVYGTYRIGDGNFEPWFGERETNEAGEFKAGFSLPLLKDRNIDRRRADLWRAGASRDEIAANVEARLLRFQRFATQAYWDWVAAGQAVQIQQQLLQLAELRVEQITKRVELGDLAEIAQIDNQRFIAKRNNDLIKARRSLEKTAIKMSLFYRDPACCPIVAGTDLLPTDFPSAILLTDPEIIADIRAAISVRPELLELNAARRQAMIDCQYAANLTLPKLDVKGFAGQDIGGETSSKGDKTPFELQLGVYAEVPIQRREGLGKLQVARAKLTQIDAKRQFVTDKIRAEIQDAASAVNAAFDQIQQSRLNVELTERSLELGRLSFEAGDIDLIALNIYETAVATSRLELLEAQFKYFFYLAAYETARTGTAFQ